MASPAIILKSKFVLPNSNGYKNYISYIDRDDSKINLEINRESNKSDDFNLFFTYMDYMGDEEKQGSLFTEDKDYLTSEEKKDMKEKFLEAQNNGSPMWQDVISFDNAWLEEQGLYNSKTKILNEKKIKSSVRSAVKELIKAEKMDESTIWTASIHYNTDNIHVHIAMVELNPSRKKVTVYNEKTNEWEEQYRAKRKQSSLDKMKSTVANKILDRHEKYNLIDKYIRGTVQFKKENNIRFSCHKQTRNLFIKAISHMPNDLRQWQYGYHSINKARPYIDEIVDIYLNTYHKENMKKLNELLDEQVEISKRLYGEDSRYKNYKQTKLDDLKKRMGNAVLKEMREFVKERRKENYIHYSVQKSKKQPKQKSKQIIAVRQREFKGNVSSISDIHFAILRLRHALRKKFHDYELERNIEEYDRMLEGYE